mmetsp:Transcript_34419/g.73310  ORF Transcript_34419/g.73310 Transcript_34419/m.73310 type:complete len:230 (-) Transcript_34419:2319-3008(-)
MYFCRFKFIPSNRFKNLGTSDVDVLPSCITPTSYNQMLQRTLKLSPASFAAFTSKSILDLTVSLSSVPFASDSMKLGIDRPLFMACTRSYARPLQLPVNRLYMKSACVDSACVVTSYGIKLFSQSSFSSRARESCSSIFFRASTKRLLAPSKVSSSRTETVEDFQIISYMLLRARLPYMLSMSKLPNPSELADPVARRSPWVRAPRSANLLATAEAKRFSPPTSLIKNL